jgi:hypothetical protein
MTPPDLIAQVEAASLPDESRQQLIMLIRQQPAYRAELLSSLCALSNSYTEVLQLLDRAECGAPAPKGLEVAHAYAVELMRGGYVSPCSEDALRKRLHRTQLSSKGS